MNDTRKEAAGNLSAATEHFNLAARSMNEASDGMGMANTLWAGHLMTCEEGPTCLVGKFLGTTYLDTAKKNVEALKQTTEAAQALVAALEEYNK
jgi:hypothetical protein